MTEVNNRPHYIGHRQRLKEKSTKYGVKNLSDYELLELFLFQAIPRRDVQPLVKDLLKNFGGFASLVNADKEKILAVKDSKESVYVQLSLLRELLNRILHKKISKKNVISSWSMLLEYLKFSMGCLRIKQFRVLFLNKKNILLA